MTNQEIVKKLWDLCNVLRDDGITYHQYVTELTYRNRHRKKYPRRLSLGKSCNLQRHYFKKFLCELVELFGRKRRGACQGNLSRRKIEH